MHFSIPDTQELYAELTGTTYTGYNIYINGSYHCCLRYKQLHALHEQLKRCCVELRVPLPAVFPPKRLLPLTNGQLETRRVALERYLQLVGQDVVISKLENFQNFLLNAQQETALAEGQLDDYGGGDLKRASPLDVWLANGKRLQVNSYIGDNATALLRKVCECLQLPDCLMSYFCLYLVRRQEHTLELLRRLMDFESPYLTRLQLGGVMQHTPCDIVLRKSYWNPAHDGRLMQDKVALNLLFMQTVADVEREWLIAPPDVRQKLRSLQEHNMRREYLEMARQLPLYGCLQFNAALVDYPEPETSAYISIGNKELSMRTLKGAKIYETKFRVTRMRCWRVTAIHSNQAEATATTGSNGSSSDKLAPTNLQLAFEYLMSKQSLRWITITSSQAMLMSVCLQSMVDELLNCNDTANGPARPNEQLSYVSRSGRISHSSTLSSSASTPSLSNEQSVATTTATNTSTSTTSSSSTSSSPTVPVKFLAQRTRAKSNPKIFNSSAYAAVFFRNAEEPVHNDAFEGIGDDDL